MKRLLSLASLLVVVLPGVASSAPQQDLAKGSGTDFSGRRFSFSATSTATGFGADGTARLEFSVGADSVMAEGEVTCLRVAPITDGTGNVATIQGRVTRVRPPNNNLAVFPSFVIVASDSGKFSTQPDTVSFNLFSSPPPSDGGCLPLSPGLPISSGEVVIENSFP